MTDDRPPLRVIPDALLDELVERALDTTRDLLLPEEVEEHRRFLRSLVATHPAFSRWIEAKRDAWEAARDPAPEPHRDTPDRSGIVERHDREALAAAARRTASKGRRR